VEETMTRTTEQVLADQIKQAAAEKKRRLAARKPQPGLSPLHALQELAWGWHDMRRRSQPKRRPKPTETRHVRQLRRPTVGVLMTQ
jgi:hypothetical protein